MEEHLTSLLSVRNKSANCLEYFLCNLQMEPLVQVNSLFFEAPYGKVLYCSELEKERGVRFLALGRFIEAQALLDAHLSSKFICLYSNIDFLAFPIENGEEEAPKLSLWQKVARCAFKVLFPLLSAFFWWQNSHIHVVEKTGTEMDSLNVVDLYFADLSEGDRKERQDKLYSDLFHAVDKTPEEVFASTEKSLYLESFKVYVFEKLEKAHIDLCPFDELFSYLSSSQVSTELVESVHSALDGSSTAEAIADERARELSLGLPTQFKEAAIHCAKDAMSQGLLTLDTISHLENLVEAWENPHVLVTEIDEAMKDWTSSMQDDEAVAFVKENLKKLQEKYFKSAI